MQPHEQAQFLSAIAKFVKSEVASATAAIGERLSQIETVLRTNDFAQVSDVLDNVRDLRESIEKQIAELPKARDGKDAEVDYDSLKTILESFAKEYLELFPPPAGPPGQNGKDVDHDLVCRYLDDLVHKEIAALPKPKDGVDGKDGNSVSVESMVEAVRLQFINYLEQNPIKHGVDGKDGTSVNEDAVFTKLLTQLHETLDAWPKPKDGAPGKDGTDGRDGDNGKTVTLDEVRGIVDVVVRDAVAAVPVPSHVVSGHIDRSGTLFHVFSDGRVLPLGIVVGKDGLSE